jgi:hypothetical protein
VQLQIVLAFSSKQRTLFFYEREAVEIPAMLVPHMAKALDVSVEENLEVSQTTARKRWSSIAASVA